MALGIVIGVPAHKPATWDPGIYDELSCLAAKFRTNRDTAGVHLCVVAEEEMRAADRGERECVCLGRFYLALAWNRHCNGADQELAHLFLPQIADLIRKAGHQRQLERLKAEVADVELDDPVEQSAKNA